MLLDKCYIKFDNDKEQILRRLQELKFRMNYEPMMELPYTAAYISDNIVLGYVGNTDDLKCKLTYEDLNNFVFNVNDEWTDDCDYIADYLEDVEQDTIKIGIKSPIYHKDLIDLSALTENMQDRAYEIADEYSESYLKDLSIPQTKELKDLIVNWFDKNVKQSNFWNVFKEIEISKEEFLKRFIQ